MTRPPRRCLVTGATSGLGKYCATALADRGWDVTATGRRPAAEAGLSENIRYVTADLAQESHVLDLARAVGPCPDLVIHCGVAYPPPSSEGLPDFEALTRIFQVNAFAPVRLSEALLAEKHGEQMASFVFVNSEAMFAADAKSGPYAASKAALRVLSAAFAARCRGQNAAAATVLLGPLANTQKREELAAIAVRNGVSAEEITRRFLRKSNPNLVIDDLIDFESCLATILSVESFGRVANGMMCRLDGGSAGSLI